MKTIKSYSCENCGLVFEDYSKAEEHEEICDNKHAKYRENVKLACEDVVKKYGELIKNISYKVDEDIDGYDFICGSFGRLYKFEIDIELDNGNHIGLNDGHTESLWLGCYIEKEVIYQELIKEVEDHKPTCYVGVLKLDPDDGWTRYTINGTDVMDISSRLCGQMVTFSVVDKVNGEQ